MYTAVDTSLPILSAAILALVPVLLLTSIQDRDRDNRPKHTVRVSSYRKSSYHADPIGR